VTRRIRIIIIAAAVLALLPGCVSRVAPHDPTIATGLAELQASQTRFFDELQRTVGTPDAAWECHITWYEDTRGRIAALRARTASSGLKDDPTARSLELLDGSVSQLEEAHAEGLSVAEISVLRALFDSQLRMLIQLEAAKETKTAEVTP